MSLGHREQRLIDAIESDPEKSEALILKEADRIRRKNASDVYDAIEEIWKDVEALRRETKTESVEAANLLSAITTTAIEIKGAVDTLKSEFDRTIGHAIAGNRRDILIGVLMGIVITTLAIVCVRGAVFIHNEIQKEHAEQGDE